jgi:hypothetical protein
VRVTVNIKPFSEEELAEAGLENAILNYNLRDFSSDPPLAQNAAEERGAILSLLVLGDPLNQSVREELGSAAPAQNADIEQLLSIQASRMLSGILRKSINRYAKFIGNEVVDYVRVAPRLRYRGANGSTTATGTTGGVSEQIQQEGFRLSWLFELGRNLGKDLFISGQYLVFGEDDINAARAQSSGPVSSEVRDYGARLALEYRLAPTRVLELSYSYSTDENLQPVSYPHDDLIRAHSAYVGLRNTIPTGTYTPRLARQRQLESRLQRQLERQAETEAAP